MNAFRLVLVGIAMLAEAAAQNVAWVATGIPDRNISGRRQVGVGDINQDGFEDVLAIADQQCTGLEMTLLWFVSGRDGTVLREVVSASFSSKFVAIAATGDMDGDGVPDYAACQGGGTIQTRVEVRSGLSDAVLWTVPGSWLEILGDVDLTGDGLNDLIVGNFNNANGWGEVRSYSHHGALLYTLVGGWVGPNVPVLSIAVAFVKVGDVDDDGREDFVMTCGEATGRGAGVIVSGATGAYLRVCYGELPGDGLAYNVTDCGDLDADGYRDFAVGNGGLLGLSRGVVRAFSSRTGQVIHQWTHQPTQNWGQSMASRGVDLDGDGVGDVVVGQPGYYTGGVYGAMYVYSGRTGALLSFFTGQPAQLGPSGHIGYYATTLRPPQGEHVGFISVPNRNTYYGVGTTCGHPYGAIVAYRGLPRTAVTLGPACAGNLPQAPNIGMSALGTAGVRLHLSSAPADAFAILMLGLSTTQCNGVPLPAALDPFGLPGCHLRTSIEVVHTITAGAVGIEAGHAALDLPYPVPSTGNGTWALSAQWLVLGDASTFPGGVTQAIRWQR